MSIVAGASHGAVCHGHLGTLEASDIMNVDVDEYLCEFSDAALEREIRDRIARGKWYGAHPWGPSGLADDLRKSFYVRDASRFEALLGVVERLGVAL